jgi:hypothetical protein
MNKPSAFSIILRYSASIFECLLVLRLSQQLEKFAIVVDFL